MLLQISLIFCAVHACASFDLLTEMKHLSELKGYLRTAQDKLDSAFTLLIITDPKGSASSYISKEFLRHVAKYPCFVGNVGTRPLYTRQPVRTRHAFSFMENTNSLRRTVESMVKFRSWNSNGYTYFVVCEIVEGYEWLRKSLELVWSKNILKFFLVYMTRHQVEVVSFNPFKGEILNHTLNFANAAFKDLSRSHLDNLHLRDLHLTNLHGYPWRVAMFDDPPRNIYRNGDFFGSDATVLKIVASKMNASIQYLYIHASRNATGFNAVSIAILKNEADFSFLGHFLHETSYEKYSISYPHFTDDLVVMVPKAKKIPPYMSMFLTFDFKIWLALLMLYMLLVAFLYILRRFKSFENCIFDVLAISVATPLSTLNQNKWPIKIFLICAIYCFQISGKAFQSGMTSVMVTPQYFKDIDTLDDLAASGLPVLIPWVYNAILSEEIKSRNRYIVEPRETIWQKAREQNLSCGYALPRSYLESLAKLQMDEDGPVYHLLKDRLIPAYAAYIFQFRSPYREYMEKYISHVVEYGLSSYNSSGILSLMKIHMKLADKSKPKIEDKDSKKALKLQQLQSAFYVLIFGHLLGGFIFFVEIIISKH